MKAISSSKWILILTLAQTLLPIKTQRYSNLHKRMGILEANFHLNKNKITQNITISRQVSPKSKHQETAVWEDLKLIKPLIGRKEMRMKLIRSISLIKTRVKNIHLILSQIYSTARIRALRLTRKRNKNWLKSKGEF